ncbi:hypothetical protein Ahy_A08g039689 [Arachis hypogaea]|uniref:Uncharacterized protein n=1 Tax=Arachis hypogaea TaxID=3818 RepID=A0A445BXK0_ARAHY|nr:hypothetical protein Ahy_A08g039689 [Arachis hypogaea]
MPNENLEDHLFLVSEQQKLKKSLAWPQKMSIILDVAKGLAYLSCDACDTLPQPPFPISIQSASQGLRLLLTSTATESVHDETATRKMQTKLPQKSADEAAAKKRRHNCHKKSPNEIVAKKKRKEK